MFYRLGVRPAHFCYGHLVGIDVHIVPSWHVWRIDGHIVRPPSVNPSIVCFVAELRGYGVSFYVLDIFWD